MVVFSVVYLVVFALHEITALEGSRRVNDALDSIGGSDRIAGFAFHRQAACARVYARPTMANVS
jgi:hypothetical protein